MIELAPFIQQGIIPDVLPLISSLLLVSYRHSTPVFPGNSISPRISKDAPDVDFPTDDGALYTIMMHDIDVPSRQNPINSEWQHWFVVNVPGTDVSKGDTVSEYIGPAPPNSTGNHRYVLAVFKQRTRINTSNMIRRTSMSTDGRAKKKIKNFTKMPEIEKIVAGTFFVAQYDNYVPLLYRQLGIPSK